ncbi:hypothetical protein M422DRAFT_42334 [Sphaerobolus stellatus SS14]|nr:hypothetical protein M422DRAFT_42334 [Sphaerobolus stellatus SS14]
MVGGTAGPSTTAAALTRLHSLPNALPDDKEVIMNISGMAYAAGVGVLSILLNSIARGILRDEKFYGPNGNEFVPERFLKPGVTSFGSMGVRLCPGRHLASNTLFLAAATIMQLFEVVPAKGGDGKDIPISVEYAGTAF